MDGDGNVRQAAFKGLRQDRPAEEIRAERPTTTQKAELPTAALRPTGKSGRGPDRGPTRLDRGPAPDRGKGGSEVIMGASSSRSPISRFGRRRTTLTKRDLARYLEKVGAWMIEHLKGRPCSIILRPRWDRSRALLPTP